ncbi:MAG: hypothetical protein KKG59_07450 [Nanoarchaeota archaeon]|nr:hypothetical protein [Nanoarchaeota archaeon]
MTSEIYDFLTELCEVKEEWRPLREGDDNSLFVPDVNEAFIQKIEMYLPGCGKDETNLLYITTNALKSQHQKHSWPAITYFARTGWLNEDKKFVMANMVNGELYLRNRPPLRGIDIEKPMAYAMDMIEAFTLLSGLAKFYEGIPTRNPNYSRELKTLKGLEGAVVELGNIAATNYYGSEHD